MKPVRLALIFAGFLSVAYPQQEDTSARAQVFASKVEPFFAANCYTCHNQSLESGGLNLQALAAADVSQDRGRWETIEQKVRTGEMPPQGLPRPRAEDLRVVIEWINAELERADRRMKPNPGRVTARRLNRSEYNNTVRDLLAVKFRPADDFPHDDSGYGFDNIADALSLSPVLMEKYLAAAERVTRTAIFGLGSLKPTVVRHQPPYRLGADGGASSRFLDSLKFSIRDYDVTGLSLPSALHASHYFPTTGEYNFRVSPEGNRPKPSDSFQVVLWIDGQQAASLEFKASDSATNMEGEDQQLRVRVAEGEHWVALSALRLYEGLPAKYGGLNPTSKPEPPPPDFTPPPGASPEEIKDLEWRRTRFEERKDKPVRITDVTFRVNFVEITGPFKQEAGPSAESLKRVFACGHLDSSHQPTCTRTILASFAKKAYRRPVKSSEVDSLIKLAEQTRSRGNSFDESIAVALQAVLVSPHFLFRIERDPEPGAERVVDEFELATRLSYFLWSSMPDEELMQCAEEGTLRHPAVLERQVRRMLQDPRAHALVENFGGQWLQFRALESAQPDWERFPRFDYYLRLSMKKETESFFEHIIRQDRSVLDFINGRYTFLNENLARFYGVPGVSGPAFRKVDLSDTPRGGILTHGSTLTVSSYPTRTSPVLRGKWVLENLLNEAPPPPPADVPPLNESAVGTLTSLREQLEQHRANPVCASCHVRMDPLGFGLENFDAIGGWRTHDGQFPIDASGVLPNGQEFQGPADLLTILAGEHETFALALVEKMLTYALGRGLEPYDKPTIRSIAASLAENDYRFSALVLEIVKSLPFQKRKRDQVKS